MESTQPETTPASNPEVSEAVTVWATGLQPIVEELRALAQDSIFQFRVHGRRFSRKRILDLTEALAVRLGAVGVPLAPEPGCGRYLCRGTCAECERVKALQAAQR